MTKCFSGIKTEIINLCPKKWLNMKKDRFGNVENSKRKSSKSIVNYWDGNVLEEVTACNLQDKIFPTNINQHFKGKMHEAMILIRDLRNWRGVNVQFLKKWWLSTGKFKMQFYFENLKKGSFNRIANRILKEQLHLKISLKSVLSYTAESFYHCQRSCQEMWFVSLTVVKKPANKFAKKIQ